MALRNGLRQAYRITGLSLIPILTLLVLIGIYTYTEPNAEAPTARQGVLDLSAWDFQKNGLLELDGEWAFYAGRMADPQEIADGRVEPEKFVGLPGTGFQDGVEVGTYALRVKVKDDRNVYGFKVNSIWAGHHFYVDGVLLGGSGVPAEHKAAFEAGNTPYLAFAQARGTEMVVVLRVADPLHPSNGGWVDDIQFGRQADMLRMGNVLFGTELSGVFILLLFGGYHISIYVMRRKDKAYLYSGLFFLTMLVMLVVMGEKLLLQLWPGISYEAASRIYDLGGFSCYAMLAFFLHHLDAKLISRKQLWYLLLPIGLFLLAVLVLPYAWIEQAGNLPWDYVLLLTLFYVYRTVRLFIKQDGEQLNRKETALLGGAMISIVLIMLSGLFFSLGWTSNDMLRRVGLLAVIAFMNTLLALRLAHASEQKERLTEQLILRDQLKDEFLANTSHELKTPLHGIQNIAAYLLEERAGSLTGKQRSELTLIQDTSTKLAALVNDLVDVVQMKHGDLRLEPSVLDLHVAAQTVYQVLEFELMGKDVQWINKVAPHTLVLADENRMRQVLYNVIHNAMKHTKSGWIEISATIQGQQLAVSVEDTGVGIAAESHEAIFGYFEQAESVPEPNGYRGMGLGLYISRQLVERMGGRIFVDRSAPGNGTRITFTVPLAEADVLEGRGASVVLTAADGAGRPDYGQAEVRGSQRGTLVPNQPGLQDAKREHTVLVVDDEASNVRILLNLLGDHHHVLTAFSAGEALRKLEEHPGIDLMILDVMMPEMSGIDLCKAVRETRSILELPILFATAKDSLHDIELCFRAGGNDFIAKPFNAKTLNARVHTLLSMKSSMDQALQNEMAFLQAQIKPHFLYNALSSIISFCYTDGEKAAYLLSMLSRYLRMVFERDLAVTQVPLYLEVELTLAYVEIEKARFGDRFQFQLQADPGLEQMRVPSLCIQPFVENAIRHGLFEKEGPGTVTLTITDGDGHVRFTVEDDGVGMADDMLYRIHAGERAGSGIGMTNVRKRLQAIRGATVTVDSALERGTKVTVFLPKNGGLLPGEESKS
ncbi:signal transduction histidine kinase LytS [Tumebacillus sp. BK434]|uniref:ATP-binding protein n=1 Tax=Tumebacillus sp. BK434 TaxID=2512169 RepID=UPI00104F4687|nr:ATP-binding protein [Tumebacillus sp. BK434]TCP55814.1 signal transduction histidine kinase LytS [Tumebacillus sp. BK434]